MKGYTDDIRKFISGINYSGTNIKTSDGKLAYITNTGIAKPYASDAVLSDLNGCKSNFTPLNSEWTNLGMPVGSLMVNGQSCGNETVYVQSMPPKSDFDWNYYIQANPDLNLTTELQAKEHWTTAGMHQGLLPNEIILDSMANVGKIGYVDVNTTLHNVPSKAYTYTGNYKTFDDSNIIGNSMKDCSRPIPLVKYGDQLLIMYSELFAHMTASSVLQFGKRKANFFIRPPVGNDSMQGYPLKYGDQITLTMSSANSDTKTCGWWGCKVGHVNPDTLLIEFGPGGETGGTSFTVRPPKGSSYESGAEIKYGDPISLLASMAIPTVKMDQNYVLMPGKHITSLNGKYIFTYQTDGNVCLYNVSGGKSIWCSMKTHKPGKLVMQSNGTMVAYNYEGSPAWSTPSPPSQSVQPYYVNLQNDGIVMIYDAKDQLIWSTKTGMSSQNIKSDNVPKVGYVYNNHIKFGTWAQTKGKDIFSFHQLNNKDYDVTCDISNLQQLCNSNANCNGFIHSSINNTWQMISSDSTAKNYKITETNPMIYVKEANVDMKDKSCIKGKSHFIDSSLFSNYPKGNDFVLDGDQCNAIDMSPLTKKQMEFTQDNQNVLNQGEKYAKTYPNLNRLNDQNNHLQQQLYSKTNEYKKVLSNIKKYAPSVTYDQQKKDMAIFEESNQINSMIWGISAIIVIGLISMIKLKE